jgi:hypothetical protein
MATMKPAIALDPALFGRKAAPAAAEARQQPSRAEDVRLFAMTFAAGFLFVSVLIA